jgi:hypothetical protein
MGQVILLLASEALLAAMAGCSLCHPCQGSGASCPPVSDETPPPAMERVPQEPAIRELAASVLFPQRPDDAALSYAYRAIAPQLCQGLSAKHAPLADGFDSQRRQLEEQLAKSCCRKGRLAEKRQKQLAYQQAMLLYSALESRDQAAGTALEWYYQLAGAEAKADLLDLSLERSSKTLQRLEKLKGEGVPLLAPIEEYQRQIVDVQLQQGQNQLTIEQLNSKLRLAMGYDFKQVWRIWPDPGMPLGTPAAAPVFLPPDVEAAVAFGLHQRPQLLLLRYMIAHLDRDTLGAARMLLQAINPLFAMSSPGPSCKLLTVLAKILHIEPGQQEELERVRAQLCDYLHDRERTVEAEIRAAVYEIGTRRETILRARQAADSWEERIHDLEKQRAEGLKGPLSLASAYLEWYKARGEVVNEFLRWKIAAVKLKQAQGILPAECGYSDCKEN